MIRVLLTDDHALLREGIRQFLSQDPEVVVLGEASSAEEAHEQLRRNTFDVMVLDVSMPGRSGVDVLRELRQQYPNLRIIIFSMHAADQYAVRCLKAGASAYLTKESAPTELLQAVRRVATGRRYITPALAERLAEELDQDGQKPLHENLSDREHEVMLMIASGKTLTEIADQLCLSVKTVSTYRTRILQKMGQQNNLQIIRYAMQHALVE